jgi:pimeloyl-[acyl-carrier protein] methyl ester esterase
VNSIAPKPVLALLHGWGMNARVFDALAGLLAADFEVRALDLPGHGGRAALEKNTLQSWADDLARQLPDNATLLGWSLGGQVAMRAALDHPRRIARLVLLASTPKFVATEEWVRGMAIADLQAFGAALLADPQATLLRFLSLQTRGMEGQKTLLQHLRQTLLAAPQASSVALAAGLAILHETDLRADLPRLTQPTLVLHGALDTLTPAAAGTWLAGTLPDAQHIEIAHAAHAPHLSHGEAVAAAIGRFAHG